MMMAEESPNTPLSSSKINPSSSSGADEEYAGIKPKQPPLHRRKTNNKWLIYLLSGFTILCAILLIFAQFVLRPTAPDAEISFVRVENLTYTTTAAATNTTSSPSFSVTLWTEFKIKNRSFGRFNYENSTATVMYGSSGVGEAVLAGRRVGAKETNFVNVKVSLRSASVGGGGGGSGNPNLSGDLKSGVLNLSCYGELSGEVDVLKVFKKRRSAVVDCNMNLILDTRKIEDLFCN